jgi:hypothetical protein
MPTKDARVDAYIAQAAPFARPILERLRRAFHQGCPQAVETLKWSMPHFEHQGILGSMAAFKKHVSLGFWKGTEIGDPAGILERVGDQLLCAVKFAEVSDLPAQKVLVDYVKRAARLNESSVRAAGGTKAKARPRARRPAPKMPSDLKAALAKNARARAVFEAFPPGHQREYIEWITEARKDETRARRLVQAVEWIAESKTRNWKYERPRATARPKPSPKKKAAVKKAVTRKRGPARKKPRTRKKA